MSSVRPLCNCLVGVFSRGATNKDVDNTADEAAERNSNRGGIGENIGLPPTENLHKITIHDEESQVEEKDLESYHFNDLITDLESELKELIKFYGYNNINSPQFLQEIKEGLTSIKNKCSSGDVHCEAAHDMWEQPTIDPKIENNISLLLDFLKDLKEYRKKALYHVILSNNRNLIIVILQDEAKKLSELTKRVSFENLESDEISKVIGEYNKKLKAFLEIPMSTINGRLLGDQAFVLPSITAT